MLLKDNYCRISPRLPWSMRLDDVGAMKELCALADDTDVGFAADFLDQW